MMFDGYTSDLKLILHKTGFGFKINIDKQIQDKYKLYPSKLNCVWEYTQALEPDSSLLLS